jgi:hypothetical protein
MAKNVLLSVDLNNITADQRKLFNEALAKNNWVKHNRLTTIWTAVFKERATDEGAVQGSKKYVDEAALAARISSYDVLIHVGDSKPVEYSKG